jgi:hypothetical protein
LFNQTPDSLRRIGARGGRACARNRRWRQGLIAARTHAVPDPVVPAMETTAEAIATLDARFPWLRQAELRPPR